MSTELLIVEELVPSTNDSIIKSHQIIPTGGTVLRTRQNEMLKTLIDTAFHFSHVRSYPCESDELTKVFVIGAFRAVSIRPPQLNEECGHHPSKVSASLRKRRCGIRRYQ